MKNIFAALFLAGTCIQAQEASTAGSTLAAAPNVNQPCIDIYAIAPRGLNGAGFGMGGFSPAIPTVLFGGADLRFGGDFYFTSLDRRTIRNVPLQAPQTGEAKVRLYETMFAFNAVARLSMPWTTKVSPYLDGFAGLRAHTAGISVTPEQYQPGYEESSSENLDAACSFQYGAAAGILVSLGRNIKLNTGIVFSRSLRPGTLSNIHTAGLEGTGLVMDKKALNRDMILFKVGITFRFDPAKKQDRARCCQCCGARTAGSTVIVPSGRTPAPNRVGVGTRVSR